MRRNGRGGLRATGFLKRRVAKGTRAVQGKSVKMTMCVLSQGSGALRGAVCRAKWAALTSL